MKRPLLLIPLLALVAVPCLAEDPATRNPAEETHAEPAEKLQGAAACLAELPGRPTEPAEKLPGAGACPAELPGRPAAPAPEPNEADRFLLAQARLSAAQLLSRDGATADDWLASLDAALALPAQAPYSYNENGLVHNKNGLAGRLRLGDECLLGMIHWRPAREAAFLPLLCRLPDPDRWPAVRAGVAARIAAAGGATNAPPLLRALSFSLARIDGDEAAEREARAALDAIPVLPGDDDDAYYRDGMRWLLDHPGRIMDDWKQEQRRADSGAPPPEPGAEDPGDFAADIPDDDASATNAPARPACRPMPPRPVDTVWTAIKEGRYADAERAGFALFSHKDADRLDADPTFALLELYRRAGGPEDIVAFAEGNPLWRGKDIRQAILGGSQTSAIARALLEVSRTNDAVRIARNALFESDRSPGWAFDLLRDALPPADALAAFETAAAAFPCDPRPLAAAARSLRDLGRAEEAAAAARRALSMPPLLTGLEDNVVLSDALLALDPGAPLPAADETDVLFGPAEEALKAGRTNDAVRIYTDAFASLAAGYARTVPVDPYYTFCGRGPDERLAAAWRALPALAGAQVEPPRNLPAWTADIRPEPLADPAARAGASFLLGRLLECSDRPRAAFEQYRAALSLDPRHADAAFSALKLAPYATDPADRADLERALARLGAVPADFGGCFFDAFGPYAVDAKALLEGAAAARRRLPPPDPEPVFLLGGGADRGDTSGGRPAGPDTPAAAEFAELLARMDVVADRRDLGAPPGDALFSYPSWTEVLGEFLLLLDH